MIKLTENSQKPDFRSDQQLTALFEILRSAVFDCEPQLDPTIAVDWDFLFDCSSTQGILAWVWDGISRLPKSLQPSRQQRINWALSAQEITDHYVKQKSVLAEMVQVCRSNGLRLLLLKGIGLSKLYPKPALRPSGDIDVFFPSNYDRGNHLFCSGTPLFIEKHAEFYFGGELVENHMTFLDVVDKHNLKTELFLESSVQYIVLKPEGYYEFKPLENFVFNLAHWTHHFGPVEVPPLRSMVDLAMMLQRYPEELSRDKLLPVLHKLCLYKSFVFLMDQIELVLGLRMTGFEYFKVSSIENRYLTFLRNCTIQMGWGSEQSTSPIRKSIFNRAYLRKMCECHFVGKSRMAVTAILVRHHIANLFRRVN